MIAASKRRSEVLGMIEASNGALSASNIATTLGVSRQLIVGDVALLRAEGHQIIATARGYMMEANTSQQQYRRKIACCHQPDQTREELYILIDCGVTVEDVMIEHHVYGELTGSLGLSSRLDVDAFLTNLEQSKMGLLSELTQGVHLHTISCKSREHFDEAMKAMSLAGFLVKQDD